MIFFFFFTTAHLQVKNISIILIEWKIYYIVHSHMWKENDALEWHIEFRI